MNTDTERLDFLEREEYVSIDKNTERGEKAHLFTATGQHLDADTLREAIDTAMLYESGERCWYCEHWDFHPHEHKDKSVWKGGKANGLE